jgi:tRNA pseudouridine55 synthase
MTDPAARPQRAPREEIHGVLVLDKPRGLSSSTAVLHARRLLGARKAGHTGTLDPLASGLLPLALGEATKFSQDLLDADKTYEARIDLGVCTDSGDAEGAVTARAPVDVGRERFEAALAAMRGPQLQVPPMHSALKQGGRPLYELARAGRSVEREPRPIVIHELVLIAWHPEQPRVRVRCSKGTYIRVLAQDLGAALGCGAHLGELRRTAVGPLDLEGACSLEQLEALDLGARRARLLPPDALLAGLPSLELDGAAARRFGHGQVVAAPPGTVQAERLCVRGPGGQLLGLGRPGPEGIEPVRLVASPANAKKEMQ